MTNFIFKSANRLIKNSPITTDYLNGQLNLVLTELRHQRSEHREMSLKLEKLLIDKHLQTQVDRYFEEDTSPQTDSEEQEEE